jgi:hypothetical protein
MFNDEQSVLGFQFDKPQKFKSMSDAQPHSNLSNQVPYPPSAPVGVASGLYPTDQMGNPTPWIPHTSRPGFPPPGHSNHLAPLQLGYRGLPSPTHNHWGPVNYFSGPLDTTSFNQPAFNQGTGVVPSTGYEPANNMANPPQITFRNAASAEVNGDFSNVFNGEQGQRAMGPPRLAPAAAGKA